MTEPELAAVAASSPFPVLATAEELAAELREPGSHPGLAPHAERLLLELPAQIVLAFCVRHGIPTATLRRAYAWHSARDGGLRNPELEAALDELA
jgi:hypothetical protein